MAKEKKNRKAKVTARKVSFARPGEKKPEEQEAEARKTVGESSTPSSRQTKSSSERLQESLEKYQPAAGMSILRNASWAHVGSLLIAYALPPIKPLSMGALIGRAVVYGVLFLLSLKLIFTSIGQFYGASGFLHNINLPFHEAGHIFFIPLGRFMTVLGGSLLQVLVPLGVAIYFLTKNRDGFGAAICLWWAAESMMDVAVYMNDARAGQLMLIHGATGSQDPDFHDWYNLFRWTGLLAWDTTIASFTFFFGKLLMIVSLVWAGVPLWVWWKHRKSGEGEGV